MSENNPKALTVMGFDFGAKRIGIATGQTITGSASPLATIDAQDGIPDWSQLSELIETWQPDKFVVGLPLNMDDSWNEMCNRARKFGRRLQAKFKRQCFEVDERLSTREAKQHWFEQRNQAFNVNSQPVDSFAAALILETWLSSYQAKPNK